MSPIYHNSFLFDFLFVEKSALAPCFHDKQIKSQRKQKWRGTFMTDKSFQRLLHEMASCLWFSGEIREKRSKITRFHLIILNVNNQNCVFGWADEEKVVLFVLFFFFFFESSKKIQVFPSSVPSPSKRSGDFSRSWFFSTISVTPFVECQFTVSEAPKLLLSWITCLISSTLNIFCGINEVSFRKKKILNLSKILLDIQFYF